MKAPTTYTRNEIRKARIKKAFKESRDLTKGFQHYILDNELFRAPKNLEFQYNDLSNQFHLSPEDRRFIVYNLVSNFHQALDLIDESIEKECQNSTEFQKKVREWVKKNP